MSTGASKMLEPVIVPESYLTPSGMNATVLKGTHDPLSCHQQLFCNITASQSVGIENVQAFQRISQALSSEDMAIVLEQQQI